MESKQWCKFLALTFSEVLLGMGERYVGVSRFGINVVKQDKASGVN